MVDLGIWKKAWALLDAREKPDAWIVLGIVILAALSSAVMVGSLFPFLLVLADPKKIQTVPALSWAYEKYGFTSDYAFLVALGAASLGVIFMSNLIQIIRTWALARFASMQIYALSHKLLAAYLSQTYEYFLDHHNGEMSTQILSESQEAVNQFFRPAVEVIAATLTITLIFVVLLWVDWFVTLMTFVAFGSLYGGIFLICRRLIKHTGQIRAASNRERFRFVQEALGGVKQIKLLGREAAYVDRYRVPAQRMTRAMVTMQAVGQVPTYVMQAVSFGGMFLLCLVLIDPAGLETGAGLGGILPLLGIFAFAGQRLLPELSRLYQSLTQLNAGASVIDTINRDLLANIGPDLPRRLPAPIGLKKELRLQHVSYNYPSDEHAGIRDVLLSITVGEKIGVMGSTGAGKTTLADIIIGILRPKEGFLIVDGVKITDENLRSWQQTVGYVPQEIFLTDTKVH